MTGFLSLECWVALSLGPQNAQTQTLLSSCFSAGYDKAENWFILVPQMFEDIEYVPGWGSASPQALPFSRLWRLSDDGPLRVELTKPGKEQEPKKSQLPPLR